MPWFKRYAFPFFLVPVSWEARLIQFAGVPLTAIPGYLTASFFEEGSLAFLLSSATLILLGGFTFTLALWHTEKN